MLNIFKSDDMKQLENINMTQSKVVKLPTAMVNININDNQDINIIPNSNVPSHGRLIPLVPFIIVYACMSLGTFLGALDQTIVSTIVPHIATEFSAASEISWVGTSFLLTSTSFQPVFGSLCDVFGRKASFLLAMGIFGFGTLLCGIAPNIITLILARAIAGIGGGGLQTTVQVIVSDVVSLRQRGKYHGILQTMNAIGNCIGPLVGGIFASHLSWRWAFYFQVPIATIAFIIAIIFLPQTSQPTGKFIQRFKTLDYIGIFTLVIGVSFLMTAITYGGSTYPWLSPVIITLFFFGISFTALFLYNETLASVPIIPLYLLKNISVDLLFIANACFGYIFFCALYYLPLFFQVVYSQSALQSGLSIIPLTIAAVIFSWISGILTSYTGDFKLSIIPGYTFMLISTILIYTLGSHTSRIEIFIYMLLLGIGTGLQLQASLIGAQAAVHKCDIARTTAVRNFTRNLGGVFGLGISASILNSSLKGGMDTLLNTVLPATIRNQIIEEPLSLHKLGLQDHIEDKAEEAYISALKWVFVIWIPFSMICLICAIIVPRYSLDRGDDGSPIRKPYWFSKNKNKNDNDNDNEKVDENTEGS